MAAKKETEAEARFTKEQLLQSARFNNSRILVSALLEDGRQYTVKEAEEKIQKYLKGKVI